MDQHPAVGSIDSKTGKPVTELAYKKIEPMLLKKHLKKKPLKTIEELRMSTTIAAADEPLERIIKTFQKIYWELEVLVPVTGDRSRVISGGMDDIRAYSIDTKHTSTRRSKLLMIDNMQAVARLGHQWKMLQIEKTNEHAICRRRNWIRPLWRVFSHEQRIN